VVSGSEGSGGHNASAIASLHRLKDLVRAVEALGVGIPDLLQQLPGASFCSAVSAT
jgi:hypothetical protein